jgi:nucleoside-diphosphate-sugar epimerase
MRILIIGATGYLGSAAARALRAAGHEIVGLARSDEARDRLVSEGYEVAIGDVADAQTLVEPARKSDGILYAVMLNMINAKRTETFALQALVDALAGSSKPLLLTSGVWCYGATGDNAATEATPPNPPAFLDARPVFEGVVLDAVSKGVRSMVVRPGIVYGEGKGIPTLYVGAAHEQGGARVIGDGSNHWSVVHVDDVAKLYTLMFEAGKPGDVFNATDETAFTQSDIAQAANTNAGRDVAPVAWPLDAATAALGEWVEGLTIDQRVSSAAARTRFGWQPRASTIVDDIERGSYVGAAAP